MPNQHTVSFSDIDRFFYRRVHDKTFDSYQDAESFAINKSSKWGYACIFVSFDDCTLVCVVYIKGKIQSHETHEFVMNKIGK